MLNYICPLMHEITRFPFEKIIKVYRCIAKYMIYYYLLISQDIRSTNELNV